MIICLLWKLADCLSPVPEELPLKGVPLEKHHKSGFSDARTHKGADRTVQDREGRYSERRRERDYVIISIYTGRSTALASLLPSLEQPG